MIPYRWSASLFREMFGYAANFQVNGIAQLLFEPTTKALLSKWGTLSDVGYFEMASRMVMQIRSLLVAANQVMVPVITTQQERTPTHIPNTYKRCYDIMFYLSIPIFSLLLVVTPLISEVWIGAYQPTFVVFAFLLITSWALNTSTVPAYLAFVGTGQLRWNTLSHMLMGVTNLLLGYIMGYMFGSIGVIVGTCLAILAGSLMTLLTFHAEHHLKLQGLVLRDSRGLLMWSIFGVGGGLFMYYLLRDAVALWIVAVLVGGLFLGLVGPSMWQHRIRTFLVDGLRELCSLKQSHQQKH
jgi:O-antigen/teichoic acid export membrane protein